MPVTLMKIIMARATVSVVMLTAIALLTVVTLMSPMSAVAAPSCEKNPNHASCDDTGSESDDLYTVAVYFEGILIGAAANVEGGGNESRPKIGEATLDLDLTQMVMAADPDCVTVIGNLTIVEDGRFVVLTARIPKSGPFTFVTASYWGFKVNNSAYTVIFGPDDDGEIDNEDNWPPASSGDVNFLTGEKLLLQVGNGPDNRGACDDLIIPLSWKIIVTKE